MTDRQWYPSFLVDDEYIPEGRASVEAWLPFLLDGDPEITSSPFKAGDEIAFCFVDRLGEITITVGVGGEIVGQERCSSTVDLFDEQDTAPSAKTEPEHRPANNFWNHETEIFATTLQEFADYYAEQLLGGADPEVTVDTAYWSDEFRCRISDDEKSLILITQPATATAQETPSC